MLFRHSMSIARQLRSIYNTTVHNNKSTFALNVDTCWSYDETPTCHKGRNRKSGGSQLEGHCSTTKTDITLLLPSTNLLD